MLARILGVLLVVAAGLADADHCASWSTSQPEIDSDALAIGISPRYYVDNDQCDPSCTDPTWVYEESNGLDGLQRTDDVVDDTCHGMIVPDTLHF